MAAFFKGKLEVEDELLEVEDDLENSEKPRPKIARTATELQRYKLEKLFKNPEKLAPIPTRPQRKSTPNVPDFVRNVMGSSAGAGSGEFHVYRHLRRKEYARQKWIQEKARHECLDDEYRDRIEANKLKLEEQTAKRSAKRKRKKKNHKGKKNIKLKKESSESEESDDEDLEENKDKKEESINDNVIKPELITNNDNDKCDQNEKQSDTQDHNDGLVENKVVSDIDKECQVKIHQESEQSVTN